MDRILILMRHGHYDFRDLSPRGEEQARSVALKVANDNIVPELIVHSPQPRTIQTMQQISAIFASHGHTPQIMEAGWLHDNRATEVRNLTILPADKRIVMLVTHLPNVEDLTADFNARQTPGHASAYAFMQQADTWAAFKAPRLQKLYQPA